MQAGRSEEAIRTLQETLGSEPFKDEPEALGTIHSILGDAYRETGSSTRRSRACSCRSTTGEGRGQARARW